MLATDDIKIGVVTFPVSKSGAGPLSNLVEVLLEQSKNPLYVITGNDGSKVHNIDARVQVTSISHQLKQNIFSRSISYAVTQIRISLSMLKATKNVDKWLFFIGGELLVLPIISAKITRKPTILLFAGSPLKQTYSQKLAGFCYFLISTFNRVLCDKLMVYSPMLISEWNLEKYRHKILIAHRHFLDFNTFTVTTPSPPPPLIGYIGRLSGEKASELRRGLPCHPQRPAGPPSAHRRGRAIERFDRGLPAGRELPPASTSRLDLRRSSKIPQPAPPPRPSLLHRRAPEHHARGHGLRDPSLATPVGAIPDVIIDGKTDLLWRITPGVHRGECDPGAELPDLEEIADAGRRFVEEFTFERVVERWKEVLEEI